MHACTFFGHRDCSENIKPILKKTLIELVKDDVTTFYVGNNGMFDSLAISVLKSLKKEYSNIDFYIVLAYLPSSGKMIDNEVKTLFPEGIEKIPKKFAIVFRNIWMIEKSDYVVTFVTRPQGGAAQFYEQSIKKGKKVINLGNIK